MKTNKFIGTALALAISGLLVSCNTTSTQATAEETTETATTETTETVPSEKTDTSVKADTSQELAAIQFEEVEYNFGTVVEGTKVEHVFKFKNTGSVPLVVQNVQPACGCTAPEWSKEPVAPNETGEIKLVFDSKGRPGVANKTATITANIEGGTTQIALKGTVEQAGSVPTRQ